MMPDEIICLSLLVLLCVKNAFSLRKALRFRRDVKANAYIRCQAEVIAAHGSVNRSYFSRAYVRAVYSVDGTQIRGRIICGYDSRVEKGESVTLIVPECDPKMFAFSEQQVKQAVLKYSVMTAAHTLFTAVLIIVSILAAFEK